MARPGHLPVRTPIRRILLSALPALALLSAVPLPSTAFAQAAAATVAPEEAAGATAAVEQLNAAILQLMKAAQEGVAVPKRVEDFSAVFGQVYDLTGAIRFAAPPFAKAPEAEQQALLDAFARRSAAQYVDRFDGYGGEELKTVGVRTGPRNTTLVDTDLVRTGGKEPVRLTYVLRKLEGGWKIIDVLATGTISQLSQQRSDFAAALKKGGVPALTAELAANAEALLAAAAAPK